jgi:hypothetical protein
MSLSDKTQDMQYSGQFTGRKTIVRFVVVCVVSALALSGCVVRTGQPGYYAQPVYVVHGNGHHQGNGHHHGNGHYWRR